MNSKKKIIEEIDKLVEDIQVSSVLNNNRYINKIFSEKIVPVLFEIKIFHLVLFFCEN